MADQKPLPSLREREIFNAALDKTPGNDRNAYLIEACGDDCQLLESVRSLIRAHEAGSPLIKDEAKPWNNLRQPPADIDPGTNVDDFLILKKLESPGGCGVVYKAQQKSLNHREVALKVIRPDLNAQAMIERFNLEKNTLGTLNHRNIVNIIAGGTFNGQPYFAMEYVDGMPITKFADKNNLTISQRLALFEQVCDAVKYAHERGVIHRDLKPSNILVAGKPGEEPLVKVIDFGIAKSVNNGLPLAYATQVGLPIGTPAYMSPEQTGADPESVSESSDIYALGVLLYELLVGKLPLEISGDKDKYIKTIREQIPLPPSRRINEKEDDSYYLIAKKRGLDPAQLEKLVAGDLDRIVMKCLAKLPKYRFETVEDLGFALKKLHADKHALTDHSLTPKGVSKLLKIVCWVIVGIAAISIAVFVVNSRPNFSTPEGFVRIMTDPTARNKYDYEIINRTTPTGRFVWEYLKTNNYFLDKGVGQISEPLPNGNRRELRIRYPSSDGDDVLSVVFFLQTNVLKFHDVFIEKYSGFYYSNYLSAKIINPTAFEEKTRKLNPDAVTH